MLPGPSAGGAVRRPGARRQPRQGGLAVPRPSRRLAGATAPRRTWADRARHQGRRGPVPGDVADLLPGRRRAAGAGRAARLRPAARRGDRRPPGRRGARRGRGGGRLRRPDAGRRRACGGRAGGRAVAAPAATSCPTSSAPPTTAGATWGRSSWPSGPAGAATGRRADPPGHLHPGADDERGRRLGHPLGWRPAALPSAPLSVPQPRGRALGRAGRCPRATPWSTGRSTYEDLEPYYDRVEYLVGVAGDARRQPVRPAERTDYPMPPLRPTGQGRACSARRPRDWACTPTRRRWRQQRALQRLPRHQLPPLERRVRLLRRRPLVPRADLGAAGPGHRQLRPAHHCRVLRRADRPRRACRRRGVRRPARRAADSSGPAP